MKALMGVLIGGALLGCGGGSGGVDAGLTPTADAQVCSPSCDGLTCGSDGCGGLCGTCDGDELCTAGACAPIAAGEIVVDVTSAAHPIHPEIYGVAFASKAALATLGATVNRWGGNGVTLYNWQLDVGNTASDWYYENIPNNAGDPTYGTAAYRSNADRFVIDNQAAGVDSLIVVPTIGWTAKDRVLQHPYTCGFPTEVYGAQESTDPYDPHCGNGKSPSGQELTPDPTHVATAATPTFEGQWVSHLVSAFGAAAQGGVRWYALDNEMMLWNSTHRDVHPAPVTYDEVWGATLAYAPAIRAADPGAKILGYGSWGVLDLFNSGKDTVDGLSDQHAHGDVPLAPWYLDQLAAYERDHGVRLVDCLDVHYYPQGGDALANTASLWDPTYRDPSWVDGWLGEPIQLLPRVAGWLRDHNPNVGMCITEYNFNLNDADNPIAALAEAEALGLFGKFGVRLATFWTTPIEDDGTRHAAAWGFRMMRNYDGAGAHFAEISVGAASAVEGVVAYAATTATGDATTVLLINKANAARTGTLRLPGFSASVARRWSFTAGGSAITHDADLPISGGGFTVSLPAHAMAMVVVPKS